MKNIQAGGCQGATDAKYYIAVRDEGPTLVYGQPPMERQFVTPDRAGGKWMFDKGVGYAMHENRLYCDAVGSRGVRTDALIGFVGPYAGRKK